MAIDLIAPGDWQKIVPDGVGDAYLAVERGKAGNDDVLRLTVKQAAEPFYRVQVSKPIAAEVPAGTRLRLRFRARAVGGPHPLRAVVEKNGPPYTSICELSPVLTTQWQRFETHGEAVTAFEPGGLHLRLQVGHAPGIVELADIAIERAGVDRTAAQARAALEPQAIAARIERHRKSPLRVRVVDGKGRPVAGVPVRIEQRRSAFLFGCNAFLLDPENRAPWQIAYQQRFLDLFHYATLPFYWGAYEAKPGAPQHARLAAMARWLHARGIVSKGHPLVWHEVWPHWAPTDDVAQTKRLVAARIADLISRHRATIAYWDVVNEATVAPGTKTGVGAWARAAGTLEYAATCQRWARRAGGEAILLYNDYRTGEETVALLEGLRKRSLLPDAIGIQSHMHGDVWPLEQAWALCERFARFGKPLHFTELTVLSGPFGSQERGRTWPSTPEGEQAQADYVERLYRLLYSHPAVQAITWWDLSDRGAWQGAPAGLLDQEMRPKPAYARLHRLLHDEWRTDERMRTDARGEVSVRAFHGDYALTVGRSATATHRHRGPSRATLVAH